MSVLVVDGERASPSPVAAVLRGLGHEVVQAANLKTAVETCGNVAVEMVVCDNLEWARHLAAEFAHIAVVLTTPDTSRETLMRALRAGLSDVWRLPPDPAEITTRARVVLERAISAANQAQQRLDQYVADLRRDQRAGRYIQLGMLPPNPMAIDRYRFQHRIRPSLILSGDFVDYFRISARYFAFYVADVSGHGASSAFVTVLLKNFSRRLRREYRPSMLGAPGEILGWLNRELLDQKIDKYVAIFLGIGDLERDTVCFANAGNFPHAILAGDGRSRFLERRGKPVGLFERVEYPAETVELDKGDRIVVFTDGILEVMTETSLAEKERALLEVVEESTEIDQMWQRLQVSERSSSDDITCLTVIREN